MISCHPAGWQGYTLRLLALASLIMAFPIVWFMCGVQMRAMITGLVASAVWMSVVGVNGRFIYHRCHSPPERKSALPNWNIAEFTLLIRALRRAQPKAIIKLRAAARWHLIAPGLMWPGLTARLPSTAASFHPSEPKIGKNLGLWIHGLLKQIKTKWLI